VNSRLNMSRDMGRSDIIKPLRPSPNFSASASESRSRSNETIHFYGLRETTHSSVITVVRITELWIVQELMNPIGNSGVIEIGHLPNKDTDKSGKQQQTLKPYSGQAKVSHFSVKCSVPAQPQIVGPSARLAEPVPQIRLKSADVATEARLHFIQSVSR